MYSWKACLVTILALFALKVTNPYFIENISWSWFDYLHQTKGEFYVDDIVLVDIDEKSLETFGQYPIRRGIYRDLLLDTHHSNTCLLYTSPSPRDATLSRMPSSA